MIVSAATWVAVIIMLIFSPCESVHFAVVTAVFLREADPWFILPESTSLRSIVSQTFTNWTLYVAGDGLSPESVLSFHGALERAGVPFGRVHFLNKRAHFREINYYRTYNVSIAGDCSMWCFAGVNSHNTALELAETVPGSTHVAHIDDDDTWKPEHLSNLARVLTDVEYGFAFCQAEGYSGPGFPEARNTAADFFEERPPEPCGLIHSTTAWSLNTAGWIRYRHPWEQYSSKRFMPDCCGRNPCDGALPADADMWERFWGLVVKQGRTRSAMIKSSDVMYLNSGAKGVLLEKIARENISFEHDKARFSELKEIYRITFSQRHGVELTTAF